MGEPTEFVLVRAAVVERSKPNGEQVIVKIRTACGDICCRRVDATEIVTVAEAALRAQPPQPTGLSPSDGRALRQAVVDSSELAYELHPTADVEGLSEEDKHDIEVLKDCRFLDGPNSPINRVLAIIDRLSARRETQLPEDVKGLVERARRAASQLDILVAANRRVAELREAAKGQLVVVNAATARAEAAEARGAELERVIRGIECPRPANRAPDDLTVHQCMDRKECGCIFGAALSTGAGEKQTADGELLRTLTSR